MLAELLEQHIGRYLQHDRCGINEPVRHRIRVGIHADEDFFFQLSLRTDLIPYRLTAARTPIPAMPDLPTHT